jgi:hypothetical protein
MINRTMPVSPMTLTIFLTLEGEACIDMIFVVFEAKSSPLNDGLEAGVESTREPEEPDRSLLGKELADTFWRR